MGPSGSGKSTYVREHCDPFAVVCSADDYFIVNGEYQFDPSKLSEAHGYCLRKFIHACQDAAGWVVCDSTNTTIAQVAPYIQVAQAYGYKVDVVPVVAKVEVCARRNAHGVPRGTIQRMRDDLLATLQAWPRHWPRFNICGEYNEL